MSQTPHAHPHTPAGVARPCPACSIPEPQPEKHPNWLAWLAKAQPLEAAGHELAAFDGGAEPVIVRRAGSEHR